MDEKWLEARREYNVDADGKEVQTKVVRDRLDTKKEKRDRWEFLFKAVSALGIVVTLGGIWANVSMQKAQMQAQSDRQRVEYDNKVYRESLRDLFIFNRTDVKDSIRKVAIDDYLTEISPNLYLVSNDSIRKNLQTLAVGLSHFKLYESFTDDLFKARDLFSNTALLGHTQIVRYHVEDRSLQLVRELKDVIKGDSLFVKWTSKQEDADHHVSVEKLVSMLDSLNAHTSRVEYIMNDQDSESLSKDDLTEVRRLYDQCVELLATMRDLKSEYQKQIRIVQNKVLKLIERLNYKS